MMTILVLSVVLVGLAIAGIGIKMFLQKDGQFTKTCSTVDTSTGKRVGCTCGDGEPTKCENYEKHHGVLKES
ncbi:MAG: hypothetical protein R2764_03470 [Bacteroidales bacterium]